jgi:hypothetical protein
MNDHPEFDYSALENGGSDVHPLNDAPVTSLSRLELLDSLPLGLVIIQIPEAFEVFAAEFGVIPLVSAVQSLVQSSTEALELGKDPLEDAVKPCHAWRLRTGQSFELPQKFIPAWFSARHIRFAYRCNVIVTELIRINVAEIFQGTRKSSPLYHAVYGLIQFFQACGDVPSSIDEEVIVRFAVVG